MKTFSQNTVTPPTPPTPPTAIASLTSSGITHAKSKTDDSYAFSCTFNTNTKDKLIAIIAKEFPKYSNKFLDKIFFKETKNEYYYKVELKDSELKLEYRFENPKDNDRKKIINKFNNIESAILEL